MRSLQSIYKRTTSTSGAAKDRDTAFFSARSAIHTKNGLAMSTSKSKLESFSFDGEVLGTADMAQ
jgi:hypothetical protein